MNEEFFFRDKDDPSLGNGDYSVIITKITWKGDDMIEADFPFMVGTLVDGSITGEKIVPIVVTKNLTEKWGDYVVSFKVCTYIRDTFYAADFIVQYS